MFTPNLETIRQSPPPQKVERSNPKFQTEKKVEYIYLLPKTDWSKIRKIILLVYIGISTVFYPPLLFGIVFWIFSSFMIINSQNIYSKSFEKKEIIVTQKVETPKPKIIELAPNPAPSQPVPTPLVAPLDPPKKASLNELLKKAKSSGNEKLYKRILNLQNIFNSFQGQIDFDKVDLK